MSQKIAELYARIFAKDELTPTLNTAKGGLASFGGSLLKGVGGLVGITSAAAVAGLAIKGFKLSLDAAAEAETTMVRLNATLQATGREAEISGGKIARMAESLMDTSAFDDEAIINAYNALAKFNSVPTDGMEAIVKAAMDMTAALGGDLAGNAEAIGKLLESGLVPRTWGFSEALKESIKQMLDAGDKAGALEIVMGELNKRFGGQATAQLNTYNGSVLKLKTSTGEFWEAVGQGLVGPGKDFNTWLAKNIDVLTEHIEVANENAAALELGKKKLSEMGIEAHGLFKNMIYVNTETGKYTNTLNILTGATRDFNEAAMEAGNELNYWVERGQIWQNWLDNQPSKIVATTADLTDLVNQILSSGAVIQDYGGKLSSISGYAMDYDTSVRNITEAEDKLAEMRKNHPWDKLGIEEAQLAVENLQAAQQRQTDMWVLNCLTQQLSTNGLTEAEMDFLLQYQLDTGLITADAKRRAEEQWAYVLALQAGAGNFYTNVWRTEYNQTLPWPGGGTNPNTPPLVPQAEGGNWLVTKPTIFLAGEAGPEQATFTPMSGSGGSAKGKQFIFNDDAQFVIQVSNGQTIDDVVNEVMDKMR